MASSPSPRIPASLQAVFLASNRGHTVHEAPAEANKVFKRQSQTNSQAPRRPNWRRPRWMRPREWRRSRKQRKQTTKDQPQQPQPQGRPLSQSQQEQSQHSQQQQLETVAVLPPRRIPTDPSVTSVTTASESPANSPRPAPPPVATTTTTPPRKTHTPSPQTQVLSSRTFYQLAAQPNQSPKSPPRTPFLARPRISKESSDSEDDDSLNVLETEIEFVTHTFCDSAPDISIDSGEESINSGAAEDSDFNMQTETLAPPTPTHPAPPPQVVLDQLLPSRGHSTAKFTALETAYYNTPTTLQRASFGTEFVLAVRTGNLPAVRAMLQAGISPGAANAQGETVVHIAARQGQAAVLQLLLQFGATVQCVDQLGRSPLHEACFSNASGMAYWDVVETIIERDERLFYVADSRAATPLSYVPLAQWESWQDYLQYRADAYWPQRDDPTRAQPFPPLVLKRPGSKPLPQNPKVPLLPVKVATLLANGRLSPQEALWLVQDDNDDDDQGSNNSDSANSDSDTSSGSSHGSAPNGEVDDNASFGTAYSELSSETSYEEYQDGRFGLN